MNERAMRLAFVLFEWFPYGGMQRDLVKVVKACQARAVVENDVVEIDIHCLRWNGPEPEGALVIEVQVPGFTNTTRRANFERYVQEQVAGRYAQIIGFNRMAELDYYYGADLSFTWRALHQRPWWYRQTARAKHYMRQEAAVFGPHSRTVALLLSPLQRAQYEAVHHTPSARLIDLPPGIAREHCATARASEQRAALRASLGLSDDALLVLQVGSSFNTKGVDRALLALASLPAPLKRRVHYLLLGQDKSARWLRRARRLGLAQVRIEAGRADIPDCMQGADLLLHPSRHESAGMVLLEAVVAGLPVLTTASCGYAFHVESAGAGCVCPEPFAQTALNDKLKTMLESDRSTWRANGIAYGRTQNLYDMPQQVAALLLART
ncbi:MAG: glycosyltransferase family 4 protein [Pseudomonadales bacterium]|jgi:UDP-glucose:(heptosyl)LPS alpha-1,3-glucosyltransferase|nr:glycosyltransferase family 4 protein [Pseudomonadales bacterium]